jgi:hypothetical protein
MTRTHQYDLRLVKLLLHLHDRVRLARVLVLGEVRLHLREGNCRRVRVLVLRNLGNEIVQELCEQRERWPYGILSVRDDDSYELALDGKVDRKTGQRRRTSKLFGAPAVVDVSGVVVLLDTRALTLWCALRDGLDVQSKIVNHRSRMILKVFKPWT